MSSRTPRPGWLLCLTLAAFAVGTDDLLIAGLLPVIAQDLDVGTAAAGQLVTVFSITYAVAAPPLAVATARLPRRALLLGALALFALVNLITALAPGYVALMALRVCAALVAALITPVAFAMAAGLSAPERTGRAVGVVAAGLTVSLFLGVPAGTVLGAAFGWRAAFVAVAVLTCLVLVASAVLLPSIPGSPQTGPREQVGALARPAILFCVTGTVLGASCGFMTYTYVAPITADLTGSSGVVLAPLIATIGVAGAFGALVCGRATDRWGADRVLLVTFVGMVATSVVLAFLAPLSEGALPVWFLGGALALWGFAAWGFAAPMSTRLLGLAGDAGTEALALNTGGLYVGTAVAGMVGGAVVASSGGAAVPAAAAAVGLLALVVMALSVRRYPTAVPEPLARQGSGVWSGTVVMTVGHGGSMRIGELAELSGASVRSLRYYEKRGLLASERAANGYREYGPEAVDRVRNIRLLLESGLTSEDIGELRACLELDLVREPDCAAAVALYEQRLRAVRERIDALSATEERLERRLSENGGA